MILPGELPGMLHNSPFTVFFLLDTALDMLPGKENDNHELI